MPSRISASIVAHQPRVRRRIPGQTSTTAAVRNAWPQTWTLVLTRIRAAYQEHGIDAEAVHRDRPRS